MAPDTNRIAVCAALTANILFTALGVTAIPLIGPQQDETLFVRGLLPPVYVESTSHRSTDIPFMLTPYLGALKIWLYKPIFAVAAPSIWSLRLPVLFASALSIWLMFLIARRFLSAPFAAVAALLLAADPMFLLTGTFDWGPVALQHLLALLMVWTALRAHETASWHWAAAAGLACGLGVWDKVGFLWIVAGLLAAVVAAGRGPALRVWRSPRLIAAVSAGAILGAAVFLRYNIRYDLATFRSTSGLDLGNLTAKLQGLWLTLDGSALFGFLTADSGAPAWLNWSMQGWILLAALAAIPLAGELRRAAIFLALCMAVSFLLMAAMKNAGQSAHHIVLLWPLPQLLIATAAAGLWTRGAAARTLCAVCLAACALSGLAVTARYGRLARTEGPGSQWTLASRELADALARINPPAIFVVDWGILDPLRLLGSGRLRLLPGSDAVVAELDRRRAGDARLESLKVPGAVVVTHPEPLLNFPGRNGRLDGWAAERGLVRLPVATIGDALGTTQFLIFRYAPKVQ